VHRVLKPANILLQTTMRTESAASDGWETARPVLADFGLAKRLDSESTAWTQEGAVVGTASYMAPEQAAGRVGELGPAVDVYALGAILYELLTGRPPFQASSWNEMFQQILHAEPAPPRRLHPDVPSDLETVCLKCLEKEPGRRYTSAAELGEDLGRFLDGRPVNAVPLEAHERLARRAARDGYKIVGEIGRGPRSTVYRALDEPLKRLVALKVFETGICTHEEWEARLGRSAVQWAALVHPQIVSFRRPAWWDDAPCLEMEFVPQGSLATKLTGAPSPLVPSVRLVAQLTEIVCYIHRQGVVHGNLKPSNILLAADGIPRVADFHDTGGLFFSPRAVGNLACSNLAYLAPELVCDPGMELRPNMDIFSLGAILYELLTGRAPIAEDTGRSPDEKDHSRDLLAPSRANPEVTPYLEKICLRCLRQNPWQRYSRAYNLLTSLHSFLEDSEGWSAPDRRRNRRPPEA
jgi:serine/threonine protein kinase